MAKSAVFFQGCQTTTCIKGPLLPLKGINGTPCGNKLFLMAFLAHCLSMSNTECIILLFGCSPLTNTSCSISFAHPPTIQEISDTRVKKLFQNPVTFSKAVELTTFEILNM